MNSSCWLAGIAKGMEIMYAEKERSSLSSSPILLMHQYRFFTADTILSAKPEVSADTKNWSDPLLYCKDLVH